MSLDEDTIREIVGRAEEVTGEPPRPLTRPLPEAAPFPIDALGSILGDAARAIHDRVQAPLAICGQSVLGAAALATQAYANVELPTGETKPVSIYLVTVAESGARKSASDKEAMMTIAVSFRQTPQSMDGRNPDPEARQQQ